MRIFFPMCACLISLTCLISVNGASAAPQKPQLVGTTSVGIDSQAMNTGSMLVDRLVSDKPQVRQEAIRILGLEKEKMDRLIMERLTKTLQKPDNKFNGQFHSLLQAITAYHTDEAIGPLSAYIDFELDMRSFPLGALYASEASYPVAITLAQLGGPRVRENIFQRMTQGRNEKTIRLSVYVLRESEGKEVAIILVQNRLDNVSTFLKNNGRDTNAEKENLQKMLGFLEDESKQPVKKLPTAVDLQDNAD